VLTVATTATARAASRVVIVEPSDATLRDATSRLRGELAAAGFEVGDAPSDAADDASSIASIRLQRLPSGAVEVSVSDQLTSKTVVRRIATGRRDRSARVIAIRALELLRASLLEIESPPPPPPDDVPPPPPLPRDPPPEVLTLVRRESPGPSPSKESPAVAAPEPRFIERFAIGAGAAMLASFDGLDPAVLPTVDGWIAVHRALAVRLTLAGPGFRGSLENAAGTAIVRQELARLELVYLPEIGPRWLAPMVSLGGGPYHLYVRGTATPPYQSASDDVWAALFAAGLGLGARIGPHAAVVIDGHAIFTAPRAAVAIGNERVATAGAPSLLTSLQLVASF
jgi:hypothetical protein